MAKEYAALTPEGREKLETELHHLETVKRAEVGERIRVAREFGDISENSEYDDAKNEQAWLEGRIAEISSILANSTLVKVPKRSTKVSVGCHVTVSDAKGTERKYQIVGSAEASPAEGKISNESPVGSAILGAKKGETVKVETPSGSKVELTVLKIAAK